MHYADIYDVAQNIHGSDHQSVLCDSIPVHLHALRARVSRARLPVPERGAPPGAVPQRGGAPQAADDSDHSDRGARVFRVPLAVPRTRHVDDVRGPRRAAEHPPRHVPVHLLLHAHPALLQPRHQSDRVQLRGQEVPQGVAVGVL